MKESYSILKALYSHESSIQQENPHIGTVYTPEWVAKQMVYLLINAHMQQNHNAFDLESVNFDAIYIDGYVNGGDSKPYQANKLLEFLLPLKVLDLSCGSGVLLITYIEFITYLMGVAQLDAKQTLKNFIEHCIYGVDIDPRAISGFKHILTEFASDNAFELSMMNLYCANSLIDPLPLSEASFDLIIGNPPYIGEKNNLDWFKPIKATEFGAKYYEGKMDYFYFFIYKGYELLSESGSLCYLSSNYFLTADGAKKLRLFIKEHFNINAFIDYGDKKVFPERKLHACAYVLQKTINNRINVYDEALNRIKQIPSDHVNNHDGTFKFIISDASKRIIDAMVLNKLTTLGSAYDIHQGIVSGSDKQFVYTLEAQETLPPAVKQYIKPFYKNSDVGHFYVSEKTDLGILYVDRADIDIELINWLKPHEEKLSNRREVIKNIRTWYMLTWPRNESLFNQDKIVAPQRARTNRFAYTASSFYASADVYYITSCVNAPFSLPVLTLILNTSLYFHWLSHMGKRKGNLLELYATPLKEIPLPILDSHAKIKFEQWASELYDTSTRPTPERLETILKDADLLLQESFQTQPIK